MRNFYSQYVQHCMRFYARYQHPTYFRTEIEEQNWEVCDEVIKNYTEKEREILLSVYQKGDTLPDNVYEVSVERGINQDKLWKLINDLEHRIAKRRSLI